MLGIPLAVTFATFALTLALTLALAPGPAFAQAAAERAAPPPPPTAAAAAPSADDVDRQFARISQGWRPVQRGETTLYCRHETRLGTRVGKNVCLTRQQLLDRASAGQEARDRMAKPNQCAGPCTTGS